MSSIRIKIQGYDHRVLDNATKKLVETIKRTGSEFSGPVPLPTEVDKVTVIRSPHKYKDSRLQYETRTHKRLIDIKEATKDTVAALKKLDLPTGVDIKIKEK